MNFKDFHLQVQQLYKVKKNKAIYNSIKKILLFQKTPYFCTPFSEGEMAERLNAAVLKTVLVQANGGSNPSFSAR